LAIISMFFLQAILPVIPYLILAGAAGIIYGKTLGFIIAWGGALLGTLTIFMVTRLFKQNITNKPFFKKYIPNLPDINSNKLFWLLILIRIFPVIPTPAINIGSAVSGIPARIFASSSGLALMPWAFAYVWLGDYFVVNRNIISCLTILMLILLIITVGIILVRKKMVFSRRS
jgi:uncharacterized membrane protein YdjX (TVP38/TMEM64 family)